MAVIPLTLVISLGLVFLFLGFFLREHARSRRSSAERDALLPLAEELPRVAGSHRETRARVISFAGKEPGASQAHAHTGACESGKAEHERCPDCPSRRAAAHP